MPGLNPPRIPATYGRGIAPRGGIGGVASPGGVTYTRVVTGDTHDTRGAALALPLEERAELAADLLASLDGEPDEDVEAAWAAEIERRIRTVRADGSAGRDWDAVVGELRRDA